MTLPLKEAAIKEPTLALFMRRCIIANMALVNMFGDDMIGASMQMAEKYSKKLEEILEKGFEDPADTE